MPSVRPPVKEEVPVPAAAVVPPNVGAGAELPNENSEAGIMKIVKRSIGDRRHAITEFRLLVIERKGCSSCYIHARVLRNITFKCHLSISYIFK